MESDICYFMDSRIAKIYLLLMIIFSGLGIILRAPREPSDLPRAEPILPGHTLLRPAFGMLKSAIKFPQKTIGGLVDGNPDNIGLKYGGKYLAYSSFRRDARNLNSAYAGSTLNSILDTVQTVSEQEFGQPHPEVLVVVEEQTSEPLTPRNLHLQLRPLTDQSFESLEERNGAAEIVEDISESDSEESRQNFRRKGRNSSASASDSTTSDSYEKNPGNPFTTYKERYNQNWPWDFKLGDHMNVNPYGPSFSAGPSGADMFFSRKWWYFNQDDFKPF